MPKLPAWARKLATTLIEELEMDLQWQYGCRLEFPPGKEDSPLISHRLRFAPKSFGVSLVVDVDLLCAALDEVDAIVFSKMAGAEVCVKGTYGEHTLFLAVRDSPWNAAEVEPSELEVTFSDEELEDDSTESDKDSGSSGTEAAG